MRRRRSATDDFKLGDPLDAIVTERRGGTLRYRVPAAQLRRFERSLDDGKRPSLTLLVLVTDAEGNSKVEPHAVRVRR